jgi:hypothetical protein
MTKLIQPSFAGGEVSESVGARVDVDKYKSSLSKCENMYVKTSGGVANRPGLEYVCEVKDSTKIVRIIPFEYNTEQTYTLEFGDLYMRVVTGGGLVVDSDKLKTITGATAADPVVVSVVPNICLQSEDVTTTWTNTNSTDTANSAVAPDAATTADTLTEDGTASDNHALYQDITIAAAANTFSVYVKEPTSNSRRYVTVELSDSTNAAKYGRATFDIQGGVISAAASAATFTSASAVITSVGDGWYRCSITVTSTVTTGRVSVYLNDDGLDGGISYNGDSTSEMYIWGMQLEAESSVGSYSATTTTASIGIADGEEVFISSVAGMTELNGRQFKVNNAGTSSFEIQDMGSTDIDGAAYTAYSSGGTASVVYEIVTPYAEADIYDLQYVQSADKMTFTHPSYAPRELTRTGNDAWAFSQIVFQPEQAYPTNVSSSANTTGAVTERYVVTAVGYDTAEESLRGVGSSWTISGATQANPVVITVTGHGISEGNEFHIDSVVGMTELNGQRFKANNVLTNSIELTDSSGNDVDGTGYTAYSSAGSAYLTYTELTNGAVTADNDVTWNKVTGAESYNIYKYDNGQFGFIGSSEELTFTDDNIEADLSDTPPKTRNPFVSSTSYPSTAGFYQQRRIFGNSTDNTQRNWFTQIANFYNMSVSSPAKDSDAITATIAALKVNEIRHYIPLTELIVLTSGGEWVISGVDDSITPSTIQVKPQSYYGATWLKPIVAGDVAIYMQPGQTVRDMGYKFETDAYAGNDISILARHLFERNTMVDWTFAPAPYSILWAVRDDGILVAQTYLREQEIYGWHRHTTQGHFKSVATVREDVADITYFIVERHVGGRDVKYIERMDERDFTDVQDSFFVDSGIKINTPIAISGFTSADPVVVTTSAAHGFSNGDTVDIEGVNIVNLAENTGQEPATALNGTGYTVANVASTTFELQNNGTDVDGTLFGTYHDGGNVRLAFTSVGNLWHLEGLEVTVLANGYVVRDLTVASGTITLPDAASRVAVGLGYTCEIETLRLDAGASAETIQGKDKKISRLTVRVEDTLGFWAGPDRDHMREAKFGLPALLGQPPEMVSGDRNVTLSPHWGKEGKYVIQQRDPLPLTILSLIPDAIVGGN